jgi:plastocyanin
LAILLFGVGCGATPKAIARPSDAGSTTGAAAGVSVGGVQSATGAEQRIDLKSLQFRPKKVTVKVGTKLTFVWKEKVAHNVVFDKKGPKSATVNKGTWSPDLKKFPMPAGTYKYKCTLHPGMNGQITVK